jgi:hypothetical protein
MVLLAAGVCWADEVFPVVHNEPIAVRILDGRSGASQPLVHVVLVAGYDRRDLDLGMWREEALTDASGMVRLSDALRNLPLLRVAVLKRSSCAPDAGGAAISVERIRRDGLSAANRCGTVAAVDAAGVFAVFVKGKRHTAKTADPGEKPAAAQPPAGDQTKAQRRHETVPRNPDPAPALTDAEVEQVLTWPN